MRKLTPIQSKLLTFIADQGGSMIPPDGSDPLISKALHKLVLAGRLTPENTDAGQRYHLTAQGREDASYG